MEGQTLNSPMKRRMALEGSSSSGASTVLRNEDYKIRRFPKEFERDILESLDKRFILILLASFIVHFSTVFYFTLNPPSTEISREEIARIQRQYASLVLDKEPVEQIIEKQEDTEIVGRAVTEKATTDEADAETGKGAGDKGDTEETKTATVEERKAGRDAVAAARRRSREQISREVSSKGILGLLTGSGSAAVGEGVRDVLGEAASGGENLDEILGKLDGLERVGVSDAGLAGRQKGGTGRDVKGSRATTGAGINDLVYGLGSAKATSLSRKGEIEVSTVSPVVSEDGRRIESRNPDDVSEVVNRHNSAIQYCYQRVLKRNPDLKGKLVVRFTITPQGTVKNVTIVSSTLNNRSVERCVLNRIRRWDDFGVIDPSKGDATFRQVYTFGY